MARRPYKLSLTRARNGKRVRVYTQLYRRWKDMRSRVQGRCTDCPHLYEGLPIEWKTFAEFREFAIKNGFRKNTSPDRKDPTKGYTADNVQFIPFSENYSRVRRGRYDDYADRGPEPEPYYSDADLGAVPYEPATDRPFDDVPF